MPVLERGHVPPPAPTNRKGTGEKASSPWIAFFAGADNGQSFIAPAYWKSTICSHARKAGFEIRVTYLSYGDVCGVRGRTARYYLLRGAEEFREAGRDI